MTQYPVPNLREILPPLLASLPAATASPQPPTALLSSLSPILRQRVKLLSSADNEPWLSLLCYDSEKASRLSHAVQSDKLEPHPASGEVEVDWDGQVKTQYRRVDEETLQALVSLEDLDLNVKLIWCVGDPEGGDGWRIGEVSAIDDGDDVNWGCDSIFKAEDRFESQGTDSGSGLDRRPANGMSHPASSWQHAEAAEEEADDDDYWAQYDQTPARTPGPHHSPPPQAAPRNGPTAGMSAEDAYYAQYAEVQPAMDGYDPDEAEQNGEVETTLGKVDIAQELRQELSSHSEVSELSQTGLNGREPFPAPPLGLGGDRGRNTGVEQSDLLQPRPASSHSSSGSATVAHLERAAAAHDAQDQSEIAVKQHVSYSIKSLYRLAKAAGIERAEFTRLVKTELDLLSVSEAED